jgi:NADH-quinone oxidoreductase subunit A
VGREREGYTKLGIYIIICAIISILLVSITYILNKDIIKVGDTKYNKYECGEEEYKETSLYSIMYYKIAVTYLVFDIETILLFPTALINYTEFQCYFIYIIIILFIIILLFGLCLEYFNDIYN